MAMAAGAPSRGGLPASTEARLAQRVVGHARLTSVNAPARGVGQLGRPPIFCRAPSSQRGALALIGSPPTFVCRASSSRRGTLAPPSGGDASAMPALRTPPSEFAGVPLNLVPLLLRLGDLSPTTTGGTAGGISWHTAGLLAWRQALQTGLSPGEVDWPAAPLRTPLLKCLADLDLPPLAQSHPALLQALLKSVLEATQRYERGLAGVDNVALDGNSEALEGDEGIDAPVDFRKSAEYMAWAASQLPQGGDPSNGTDAGQGEEGSSDSEDEGASLARRIAADFLATWRPPAEALRGGSRAFGDGGGLDCLLGGGGGGGGRFDAGAEMWRRKGWGELDLLRRRLEGAKELRDVIRALGRGAGWGPLRRSYRQVGRQGEPDGLLRSPLEMQEVRGLARGGDISRMLPGEASLLAKGRSKRAMKLLFLRRWAERALLSYQADGWSELPAALDPSSREVRPTAERGPILLCVDSSGSMRGAREAVCKAAVLECMRAAREQQRGCHVFAFSGPRLVEEHSLSWGAGGVSRLLDFLERTFNGGTDFNEPLRRCLERLEEAAWSNSDVLLVTDGELRMPDPSLMRRLEGAKAGMGLRVHGLVVGRPGAGAEEAVLRVLCQGPPLPGGKSGEVLISEVSTWSDFTEGGEAADFDDALATAARRERGRRIEAERNAEVERLKREREAV